MFQTENGKGTGGGSGPSTGNHLSPPEPNGESHNSLVGVDKIHFKDKPPSECSEVAKNEGDKLDGVDDLEVSKKKGPELDSVYQDVPEESEADPPDKEVTEPDRFDPDVPMKCETVTPEEEVAELNLEVPQKLEAEVQVNEGADANKNLDGEAPEDDVTEFDAVQQVPKDEVAGVAVQQVPKDKVADDVVQKIPKKQDSEPPENEVAERDVGQNYSEGLEAEPPEREGARPDDVGLSDPDKNGEPLKNEVAELKTNLEVPVRQDAVPPDRSVVDKIGYATAVDEVEYYATATDEAGEKTYVDPGDPEV